MTLENRKNAVTLSKMNRASSIYSLGAAAMFEDVDTELKQWIDCVIKTLEDRIIRAIARDDHFRRWPPSYAPSRGSARLPAQC